MNRLIDEERFPIGWRFNANDCSLNEKEKNDLILLDHADSIRLWRQYLPVGSLRDFDEKNFTIIDKTLIDFNNQKESVLYFSEKLNNINTIFFFWGGGSSAVITRKEVFIKGWDDFFYPSDEDSILIVPNKKIFISSFEETFFYGKYTKKKPRGTQKYKD